MTSEPLRVLLADDHAMVRAGIRALLEKIPDIQVVAEAGSGRETLTLISEHRPDLLLLDIAMPDLSGLEVLAELQQGQLSIKVIILTIHDNPAYAVSALRAGANGYLPKKAAGEELVKAIGAVMLGETYLSPAISSEVFAESKEAGLPAEIVPAEELTPRQRDVLRMIAEGYSTKEIARTLNISVKTVETHRALLMQRLDIHDVAGLVRYAIRTGVTRI